MKHDNQMNDSRRGGRVQCTVRRTLAFGLLSIFSFSMVGCSDFFQVENPTNLIDEDLNDPNLAEALGNTPEVAVAGWYAEALVWTGAMSDEAFLSGSGTFRILIEEGFTHGYNQLYDDVYNGMAAARWIADNAALRSIELSDHPTSDIRVAQGYYWGGVARITLADLYEDVVYDGNPPITPVQAINDAIEKFDLAADVAQAAGDASLAAAAKGSTARAYRSLYWEDVYDGAGGGSFFQQAAAAAREALNLKPNFIEYVNYAQPGSSNDIFEEMNSSVYVRMDPNWAYTKDPVSGQIDPRIKHSPQQGFSLRENWPVYLQLKYPERGSDIPISKANEARLIIAEYEAMFGDLQAAVVMINVVRAAAGLPAFSSTDKQAVIAQLKYERRVEMFLEMRRWQDMRYYEEIPYRWADVNKAAGVHRRWPVSSREKSTNPYYTGG